MIKMIGCWLVVFTGTLAQAANDNNSVVDLLKSQGKPSDFQSRRELYEEMRPGAKYTGAAEQNDLVRRMMTVHALVEQASGPLSSGFGSLPASGKINYSGKPNDPPWIPQDGCTRVPDFGFRECCDEHDFRYGIGGAAEKKARADEQLRECITDEGHPMLGDLYHWGVQKFGDSHFNFDSPVDGPPAPATRPNKPIRWRPLFSF